MSVGHLPTHRFRDLSSCGISRHPKCGIPPTEQRLLAYIINRVLPYLSTSRQRCILAENLQNQIVVHRKEEENQSAAHRKADCSDRRPFEIKTSKEVEAEECGDGHQRRR